jgi:hypothetical protein
MPAAGRCCSAAAAGARPALSVPRRAANFPAAITTAGGVEMIVKQYGTKIQSVQPNFDARAMNEIGFTRDHEWSMPTEEFFEQHEKLEAHELTAAAEGDVQDEAEEQLLQSLQEQLLAVDRAAGDGYVLLESAQGVDYPKTRGSQTTQVIDGANRLYFRWAVEPPLRVAVYRRK